MSRKRKTSRDWSDVPIAEFPITPDAEGHRTQPCIDRTFANGRNALLVFVPRLNDLERLELVSRMGPGPVVVFYLTEKRQGDLWSNSEDSVEVIARDLQVILACALETQARFKKLLSSPPAQWSGSSVREQLDDEAFLVRLKEALGPVQERLRLRVPTADGGVREIVSPPLFDGVAHRCETTVKVQRFENLNRDNVLMAGVTECIAGNSVETRPLVASGKRIRLWFDGQASAQFRSMIAIALGAPAPIVVRVSLSYTEARRLIEARLIAVVG